MAHFAEVDSNNIVLRVVVACNDDVNNNGGDQSEQAAEHFKNLAPLSNDGVKWVQASYNNNFRGHFPSLGDTYDSDLNIFKNPQPFNSWTLDTNTGRYSPPVALPDTNFKHYYIWNEEIQNWELDPQYEIEVE